MALDHVDMSCDAEGCPIATSHPSGYCRGHRHLWSVVADDHPGSDEDCDDGYWENHEPEVELVEASR